MATSKLLRRAYDFRLAEIGLNLSEACLLAYVAEHGPLTQTQVAERIGMGRAPAGTIIDNLSARGLLVRLPHETDRRVWLLEATAPGVELVARIADVDLKLRLELREGLTRAERQQLADTLVRLQLNLARVLGTGCTADLVVSCCHAGAQGLRKATISSARPSRRGTSAEPAPLENRIRSVICGFSAVRPRGCIHRPGRAADSGLATVIASYITAAKEYGFEPIPIFMLARDNAVIVDDPARVTFERDGVYTDQATGKPVAAVTRYTYTDGEDRYVVSFTRAHDLRAGRPTKAPKRRLIVQKSRLARTAP